MKMQKAVFFDRDGVVNIDRSYVYKIDDFEYKSGFVEFFTHCKKLGFLTLLVTNQSGINRGFYTLDDFKVLCDFMQRDLLEKCDFNFDKIYFCPHTPQENCLCRKPKIGMIQEALRDFPIDLSQSYFIGDNESDIECALNANIKTQILLSQCLKISKATFVIDNFQKAYTIIGF